MEEQLDYSLQQQISGLNVPDTVTVIGCGGFGAWAALFAAMSGVKRLVLLDHGTVDAQDLARAPFTADQMGKPKASAMRDLLAQLRPDIKVEAYERDLTPDGADSLEGEVIFDGQNDMELSRRLSESAQKSGARYVTGFYGGSTVGVACSAVDGLKSKSGEEVPVWAGSAGLSGLLAVHAAFMSPVNFIGTVSELTQADTLLQQNIAALPAVQK